MKSLVIVESPNKIASIKKYLGDEYDVLSSVGHIVYLPSSGPHRFGVNMETWTPLYKIDPKKRKLIASLRKATKNKKQVYIATDPDREGEAIGYNLVTFLKIESKYKRIRFNEITKRAILEAIKNPSTIDGDLVDSQIARRILDRIIGYKLSTLMRRKISNSPITPSAGRVQSIALKLVVNREEEIANFIPIKYVTLEAEINKDTKALLISGYYKNRKEWIDPSKYQSVLDSLNLELVVSERKVVDRRDRKIEPLKQSSLYKKSNVNLGFSARKIRSVAQRLYEGYGDGGLISYPRTDSTRLSKVFVETAQKFIRAKYGSEYVATAIKGVSGDQDAHEAIRPTSFDLSPELAKKRFGLSLDEEKLYKLIYDHTLMALMTPALREGTTYHFRNNDHLFRLSFSKVVFNGYLIVNGYQESLSTVSFKTGDKVPIKRFLTKHLATSPPPRYNDGSLIEALDKIGVGRPSTFEMMVTTLKDRLYVKIEGKAFRATDFGKVVYKKLSGAFPKIMNEKYTANMEQELDYVAAGKTSHKRILDDFWNFFEKDLETATQTVSLTKLAVVMAGKNCPKCDSPLVVRTNKKNRERFFACSNFPICKHTESDPTQKRKPYRPWVANQPK